MCLRFFTQATLQPVTFSFSDHKIWSHPPTNTTTQICNANTKEYQWHFYFPICYQVMAEKEMVTDLTFSLTLQSFIWEESNSLGQSVREALNCSPVWLPHWWSSASRDNTPENAQTAVWLFQFLTKQIIRQASQNFALLWCFIWSFYIHNKIN